MPYLKNKKFRQQNCILCKILEGSKEINNLLIFKGQLASITLNLYPYNPGHMMIFPNRHIVDIRDLTENEEKEISKLTNASMNTLDELYGPGGYNIGYNIGESSGASINHLHRHLVPRYPNELGFIDVIGGAKVIIEDPIKTLEKFKIKISEHLI